MTHETLLEVALRTLSRETTARVRAQAKVERLQRQLSRLKAADTLKKGGPTSS